MLTQKETAIIAFFCEVWVKKQGHTENDVENVVDKVLKRHDLSGRKLKSMRKILSIRAKEMIRWEKKRAKYRFSYLEMRRRKNPCPGFRGKAKPSIASTNGKVVRRRQLAFRF